MYRLYRMGDADVFIWEPLSLPESFPEPEPVAPIDMAALAPAYTGWQPGDPIMDMPVGPRAWEPGDPIMSMTDWML